jgi:hypothetical protein
VATVKKGVPMPEMEIEVVDYGPQKIEDVISQEFVDGIADRAEIFLEENNELDSAIFIYTKGKKLLQLMPEDFNNPEKKAATFAFIEKIYADCHAICTVDNLFVVQLNKEEALDPFADVEAVGDECILVKLRTRDGRYWIRQRLFTRDIIKGKEVITLNSNIDRGSYKDIGGELLADVLDPWRESGPAPVR